MEIGYYSQILIYQIDQGYSIFIEGPNGVGKTTLFRLLRGIILPDSGYIEAPPIQVCYYLSHRPYIVPGLSLRAQLFYPRVIDRGVDASQIAKILVKVGLFQTTSDALAQLDRNWPYDRQLSDGEAQRLSCARVLLARPKFVFLDEATSCCTEEFEVEFLKVCIQEMAMTCLFISHRDCARHLFNKILSIEENGQVSLVTNNNEVLN